jgi:L-ascorbate metabolism protein UlaG (beta-lactamase superfamily)
VIEPFRKEEKFLADLESPIPDGALRIWWLGQSGFLVRFGNRRLLLDPYLSDSLTRKYAATDKPHVRKTSRVIAPDQLTQIDVITSSHNHTDHLDAETLLPILAKNPGVQFVIPEANRTFVAQRLGTPTEWPIGLNDGTTASVADFEFHGIAAAHNELDRDAAGQHLYLGYVIRCGPWTLYHSGDTLSYPGLTEMLRRFGRIDLAMLPINGNKPERRVAGNLDGREAAQLARAVGVTLVVPCHYDMFEFNTADPRQLFIPECEALQQSYRILRAGESLTFGG